MDSRTPDTVISTTYYFTLTRNIEHWVQVVLDPRQMFYWFSSELVQFCWLNNIPYVKLVVHTSLPSVYAPGCFSLQFSLDSANLKNTRNHITKSRLYYVILLKLDNTNIWAINNNSKKTKGRKYWICCFNNHLSQKKKKSRRGIPCFLCVNFFKVIILTSSAKEWYFPVVTFVIF